MNNKHDLQTITLLLTTLTCLLAYVHLLKIRENRPTRRRIHDGYWNVERQCEEWLTRRGHGMRASLGVHVQEFLAIKEYLVTEKGVELETEGVSADARLAMALWMLRKGSSQTATAEDFAQRSEDTVWGSFWTVVDALSSYDILDDWIKLPTAGDAPHPQLEQFAPQVFQGARGAIDGTHIYVKVPKNLRNVYTSERKDKPTMNVLGACDFDLNFVTVYAGFEGSGHDSLVLAHAKSNGVFEIPPGTYLLGDADYGLSRDILTPHQSVKYHSWEPGARPQTAEEEYNRQHASLRNCIERAFGLLKGRFHILRDKPLQQRVDKQWRVVAACAVLHNMLNHYRNGTDETDQEELRETLRREREERQPNAEEESEVGDFGAPEDMKRLREEFTRELWRRYRSGYT